MDNIEQKALVPFWKKSIAFIIDFILSFFLIGYITALITNDITDNGLGFQLEGMPALIMIVLVVAYFVIFNKYLGGTLGKRLFRIQNK